jgi:hypothetical protein
MGEAANSVRAPHRPVGIIRCFGKWSAAIAALDADQAASPDDTGVQPGGMKAVSSKRTAEGHKSLGTNMAVLGLAATWGSGIFRMFLDTRCTWA